jgi:hypothetical protein
VREIESNRPPPGLRTGIVLGLSREASMRASGQVGIVLLVLALAGCSAFESDSEWAPSQPAAMDEDGYAGAEATSSAPMAAPGAEPADTLMAGAPRGGGGGGGGDPVAPDGQVPDKVGGPAGQQDGGGPQQGGGGQPPGGPLLIYQAELHLAVFEVEATQRAVLTIARELGGYLSYQDDTRVTIRVPAKKFQDSIEKLERVGDVVHRNIQAIDVSEEFRDTTLRLRNAEVVRERLEAILARAEKVEDALKVQAELGRVTELIETLKGKLRYMQDRIAYSTVTVHFQPRPSEQIGEPEVYSLPFPWLDQLGLPALLNLR